MKINKEHKKSELEQKNIGVGIDKKSFIDGESNIIISEQFM